VREGNDETQLHREAERGHIHVVQCLCEQGVDKEAMDDGGYTPLHDAAIEGHLSVVQCLCEQRAGEQRT